MKVKSYFEIFFITLQVLCGTNSLESDNDTRVDKRSDSKMGLDVNNVRNGSSNFSGDNNIKVVNGKTNIMNSNENASPVVESFDVSVAYRNVADVIDEHSYQANDTDFVASNNVKKTGTAYIDKTEANTSLYAAFLNALKAENTNNGKHGKHFTEKFSEKPVSEINKEKYKYLIIKDGLKVRILNDTITNPTSMHEHVFGTLYFDFSKGVMLALFHFQGLIPTYECVSRTVLWHESKFYVDDKISYLDFDEFYDNHKKRIFYDDIIDNRVLNIGADSVTNSKDTKTCNDLKNLVSLIKDISYTDFSDFNKLFESGSLKDKANLLPLYLENIEYMKTYRCLDVEFELIECNQEIARSNRIFKTYFDKNQKVNACFAERRNLFVDNVTEVSLKYNDRRKVYIINPMFSAVQIFMPEFYLYIIWKFKHLYSITELCEEASNSEELFKDEMLLLQNIVNVFINSGDKNNNSKNNSEHLYEQIQRYRCFILDYMKKYHFNTASYVLYEQSAKENANHKCFDINNINNLYQLLAFMDHKQMLDDGKIKALFDQIDCELKHYMEANIKNIDEKDKLANNGNKDTITDQEDLATKTDTQNPISHTNTEPLSTDLPSEQNEVNNPANSDVSLMCRVDFDATDEKENFNDSINEVKHTLYSEEMQEKIRLRKQQILEKQLIRDPKVLLEILDRLHVLSDYYYAINEDVCVIKRIIPIVIPFKDMVLVIFQRSYESDKKFYVAALNSQQALSYVVEHLNEVMGRNFSYKS